MTFGLKIYYVTNLKLFQYFYFNTTLENTIITLIIRYNVIYIIDLFADSSQGV